MPGPELCTWPNGAITVARMKLAFRSYLFRATLAGGLLCTSSAFAHIDLLSPEARAHGTALMGDTAVDVNSNQKSAPCGEATAMGRGNRVTTYAPGETITVRVREETPHTSYLRVVLDLDGQDFVQRDVSSVAVETEEVARAAEEELDNEGLLAVHREDNDTPGYVHEVQVTLPNETCFSCTLQVIQFMYGAPNPFYFQCADIVITGSAVPGQGGSANSGTAGAAGDSSGGGAAGSSADDAGDDGGCTLTAPGAGSAGAGVLGFAALALGLARRRSRRS
jgi:hypothetical protein